MQGKRVKEKNNIIGSKMTKLKVLKSKMFWIVVVIVVILTTIISFSVYKITNSEEYVNNKMTKLVTKYYEEDMKENTIGVNRLIVTLQTLKDAGFNIRGVKGKAGVSTDLSKAFSYIIIENPDEIDRGKVVYTIENHLSGE